MTLCGSVLLKSRAVLETLRMGREPSKYTVCTSSIISSLLFRWERRHTSLIFKSNLMTPVITKSWMYEIIMSNLHNAGRHNHICFCTTPQRNHFSHEMTSTANSLRRFHLKAAQRGHKFHLTPSVFSLIKSFVTSGSVSSLDSVPNCSPVFLWSQQIILGQQKLQRVGFKQPIFAGAGVLFSHIYAKLTPCWSCACIALCSLVLIFSLNSWRRSLKELN